MTALTNWHVEKLINTYNDKFNKDVKYIDISKLQAVLSECDTETTKPDTWLLIEIIKYPDGNLFSYVKKEAFELCILNEKPQMEVNA